MQQAMAGGYETLLKTVIDLAEDVDTKIGYLRKDPRAFYLRKRDAQMNFSGVSITVKLIELSCHDPESDTYPEFLRICYNPKDNTFSFLHNTGAYKDLDGKMIFKIDEEGMQVLGQELAKTMPSYKRLAYLKATSPRATFDEYVDLSKA